MANITRWDPMRELSNMRRMMDRMLDDSYYMQSGDWAGTNQWEMPLDIVENEDEYVVKASIPGINPEDIDVTYSNGALTIRGETRADDERKEQNYLLRERRFGSFSRTISLPQSVDSGAIQADCDAGILTLRLPKAEEVKPRRIPIKGAAGQQKTIESRTRDGNK